MMRFGYVILVGMVMVMAPGAWGQTITVNCDAGETIAAALQSAVPGNTIFVSGTCAETVTITTDDLILDGRGPNGNATTVVDGGGGAEDIITIDGARRVTVQYITVQNGLTGILAIRGASVTLDHINANTNSADGIRIGRNASARIVQCNLMTNGDDGGRRTKVAGPPLSIAWPREMAMMALTSPVPPSRPLIAPRSVPITAMMGSKRSVVRVSICLGAQWS